MTTTMEPSGKEGVTPCAGGFAPFDVHECQLVDKGEPDDGDKGDDPPLDDPVRVGEEHDPHEDRHHRRPDAHGDVEEHLEGDGAAQDFRQGGGDGRRHRRPEDGTGDPRAEVCHRRLGETEPCGDAEVRHVVLQDDEHHGGERHHPEQGIPVVGARGEVRRPVAGVDESHGDQQSRSDVFQYLQPSRLRVVLGGLR